MEESNMAASDSVTKTVQRLVDEIYELKNVVKELEVRYKKLSVKVAEQTKDG